VLHAFVNFSGLAPTPKELADKLNELESKWIGKANANWHYSPAR
jgi:hypothetical protein